MEKEFDDWNKIKKIINKEKMKRYFYEGDIWLCNVGINVGHEEDGKGEIFLRPVIVIKKIENNLFFGIPLTTSNKYIKNKYFYEFEYIKNVKSYAILSQTKTFDFKRLYVKHGKIKNDDFLEIKEKLKELIL